MRVVACDSTSTTATKTDLLLGELPNKAVELNIEVEALRELVRRGGEALHQMDSLRATTRPDP
jgi:hypothetical protein